MLIGDERKDLSLPVTILMSLKITMLSEKPDRREYILNNFIYLAVWEMKPICSDKKYNSVCLERGDAEVAEGKNYKETGEHVCR